MRNELVHLNFGSYVIEKTFEEIYDLYTNVSLFVDELERRLCTASPRGAV